MSTPDEITRRTARLAAFLAEHDRRDKQRAHPSDQIHSLGLDGPHLLASDLRALLTAGQEAHATAAGHLDEIIDQTRMKSLTVEDGAAVLELETAHELVVAWVGAARAMLGDAENYSETRIDFPKAEMEVKAAGEFGRYVFTVQRAGKVTPHEARVKAEAERVELQARIDKALPLLDNLSNLVDYDGFDGASQKLRAALTGDAPSELARDLDRDDNVPSPLAKTATDGAIDETGDAE